MAFVSLARCSTQCFVSASPPLPKKPVSKESLSRTTHAASFSVVFKDSGPHTNNAHFDVLHPLVPAIQRQTQRAEAKASRDCGGLGRVHVTPATAVVLGAIFDSVLSKLRAFDLSLVKSNGDVAIFVFFTQPENLFLI